MKFHKLHRKMWPWKNVSPGYRWWSHWVIVIVLTGSGQSKAAEYNQLQHTKSMYNEMPNANNEHQLTTAIITTKNRQRFLHSMMLLW